MRNLLKNWSLASKGLKYKLIIAFSLMSIIPLLIFLNYLIPDLLPDFIVYSFLKEHADFVLFFTCVIAVMGFIVAKGMIDPIIKISSDAQKVASGDYEHKISHVPEEDEIGDLSNSLNKLTLRIRENMSELKDYSEKTREINLEINKRVIILSGLLQISELIAKGISLDEIFDIVIEKVIQLGNSTLGFLCLKDKASGDFIIKAVHGLGSVGLRQKGIDVIKIEPGKGCLGGMLVDKKTFVLDKNTALSKDTDDFKNQFSVVNCIASPIAIKGETMAIIFIGNNKENFLYAASDSELIDIFSKQVGIAIENDFLVHRVKKLEIEDALTGLYNESFIRSRLDEEIKRAVAFQRPCAFILFDVNEFKKYHDHFGNIAAEAVLKKISVTLQDSIVQMDKAARFSDSMFALILPEKNKRQCIEAAEEIRKKVEFIFSEEGVEKRITLTGAVTENPIDGMTAADLINKAQKMLTDRKKDKIKNQILS